MTDHAVIALIQKYHVPQHVQRHCMQVGRIALYFAEFLQQHGLSVDPVLAKQGGWLHDLVKIVDFRTWHPETFPQIVTPEDLTVWAETRTRFHGIHHADAGAQILLEYGEKDLARVVRKHKFSQILNTQDPLSGWEEKLVYYADKRVKHDQIVSFAERLADGKKRYAFHAEVLEDSERASILIFELEKELSRAAGVTDLSLHVLRQSVPSW